MAYANLIILENGNTRDFISVAGVPVTSRESEPAKSSTSQKCLESGCSVWHILRTLNVKVYCRDQTGIFSV